MTRWVLDTNVFVRAWRNRQARLALDAFLDGRLGRLDFAATVWLELQTGVRSRESQSDVDRLLAPFRRRNAVLAPSADAFQQAGRILADLVTREGLDFTAMRPALHHDAILAATVREHRRVLVTHNAQDFARIQRHLRGFRFVTPYPR